MNGFEVVDKGTLPALPLEVTCPHCKKPVALYTYTQAINVVCKCARLSEVQETKLFPVKSIGSERHEPLIPLGTEGRVRGNLYKVVGFIVYKERSSKYRWREYVLFSPLHGYAFLSEYDGHWTFFQFISDFAQGPQRLAPAIEYMGEEFKLYNQYRNQVIYARGEFFWKILEDNLEYREYISPPYMLTLSKNQKEQSAMLGEHIEPEAVQEAFSIEKPMPDRMGVGAAEPFSSDFSYRSVAIMAGAAAVLLLLLQVVLFNFHQNKVLLDQTYTVTEDASKGMLMPLPGPTVEIGSSFLGSSNLQVSLRAPVTNTWFATGISLLNVKTGKEYFVESGVEFYSGYEGGEDWTEGSPETEQILSSIPNGTYQLYLEPSRETMAMGTTLPETFHLKLVQDVPIWSNFWISLLLLAVVPIVQGIRQYSFEKSRWMNSDYSPYAHE